MSNVLGLDAMSSPVARGISPVSGSADPAAGGTERSVRFPGPELAVAGVAQARLDVALLVERAIERGAVDLDIGVGGGHRGHAFGRRDQVDQLDPDRLYGGPPLEHFDWRPRGGP